MSQRLVKTTVLIDGMTCVNCENRIENALRNMNGIVNVKVSYSTFKATLTYDANVIDMDEIIHTIESHDYHVRRKTSIPDQAVKVQKTHQTLQSQPRRAGRESQSPKAASLAQPQKANINQVLGIGIILVAVFVILNQLGGLSIFNAFPQAEAGMGYGFLFVIGLLTSIHCVAMCGGINLSQCVPNQGTTGASDNKFANLRPSILYNAGRVISYTIIGGIVGGIGSVVSFSGRAKGIVAIAAGVFMVIMGLNMLNIFPWLRKFNPRMPKIFARKINEQKAGSNNSPLYIGMLNGLMPCGPLQAMQLYALSTGSPIKGALSMLLFSLGTVPLMFGLGALSSMLSKRFTQKMMQASAVLVIILGVIMFQNGFGVSGLVLPSLSLNQPVTSESKTITTVSQPVEGGVQLVTSKLTSGSYEPITVMAGVPVRWTIQAAPGTINGCNNRLLIPEYKIEKKLVVGDNVIEFTPTKTGTVPFSCWMGMIRSKITVKENTTSSPAARSNATNNDGEISAIEIQTTTPSTWIASTTSSAIKATEGGLDVIRLANCCGGGPDGPSFTKQDDIQLAQIVNGKQQAVITVDNYGLSPQILVLQKGQEAYLKFDLKQVSSCSEKLFMGDSDIELNLKGDNIIQASQVRDHFIISCWMGMFDMHVRIVDSLNKIDLNKIQEEVAAERLAAVECH